MTCKYGAPTQDGSKCSSTMMANSSIGQIAKYLMLQEVKMLKVKLLVLLVTTERRTKNGKFYISIKLKRQRLRDSMKNSDSTLTDHSTLSHNSHSTELLKCSAVQIWSSRDGERMPETNNSGLTRLQRQ